MRESSDTKDRELASLREENRMSMLRDTNAAAHWQRCRRVAECQ